MLSPNARRGVDFGLGGCMFSSCKILWLPDSIVDWKKVKGDICFQGWFFGFVLLAFTLQLSS